MGEKTSTVEKKRGERKISRCGYRLLGGALRAASGQERSSGRVCRGIPSRLSSFPQLKPRNMTSQDLLILQKKKKNSFHLLEN